MKETRTTLLLNWHANPYHTPIFVAQAAGYYCEEGIQLAILEPNDPSDVTELVGLGRVDLGLKAMIHTLAARARGYPVQSFGTLLDEPPTGLLALKSSGINCFHDIIGKKVGYVGEFGKKIIDDLAHLAGIPAGSYEAIRVGMNVTDAICRGIIDTGIGFINFQKVELEFLAGETNMLRLDQLAGLGCCCFCSVLFIARESYLQANTEKISTFMRATQRGLALTLEDPDKAFDLLCQQRPRLRNEMNKTIFIRTLPFFSRTLLNADRDWNKVVRYAQHLEIVPKAFSPHDCYTNQYVPETPYSAIKPIACCLTL
jgi:ABC-type nitrate/sulfonate/bicarbonate transport system substrate-binding protein